MKHCTIHLMDRCWGQTKNKSELLHLKGQAYLDAAPIDAARLAAHLNGAQTLAAQEDALNRLNGFYAWIEQTPKRIRAAVDHIRSRPLFYANIDGRFLVSDDAEWVRQQAGDREMDPIAREEFQLAGYVTGAETLFPNVKQLQAGEVLVATQQDDGVRVQTHRYYRFLHTEPDQIDERALWAQLDQVAVASIQRLIDYANGRQIVVPLSGGYDSRLIVKLLKRLGYDNVLTFTYGVPGNQESAYSKRVADALGLRWHFVEYSDALWRAAWQTPKRWAYQRWAAGWSSVPILQDWLAVKVMKEQRVLDPDCLFVPGHTGDFISGAHIPANAFDRSRFSFDDATDAVFSKHYGLAPLKSIDTSRQTWVKRIRDRMESEGIETAPDYANVCEKWEWQERQAKYICNSVRVYEFFGHDWWMPLWDREFMGFWQSMPLRLRKQQQWYLKFVEQQSMTIFGGSEGWRLGNASDGGVLISLLRARLGGKLRKVAGQAYGFLRHLSGTTPPLHEQSHFLLAGYSRNVVNSLDKTSISVIGGHALLLLSELEEILICEARDPNARD